MPLELIAFTSKLINMQEILSNLVAEQQLLDQYLQSIPVRNWNSKTSFNVGKVGGIKSFFFSGEGLVMDFKGPCSLYVQGRNLNQFTQFIQSIAESVSGKAKGLGGTLGRLFD